MYRSIMARFIFDSKYMADFLPIEVCGYVSSITSMLLLATSVLQGFKESTIRILQGHRCRTYL